MSNGGIAIISGIQPFQPLVGSWRPAPQALSDGIGIAIISGKHTGTGLSAARGVVEAGFTGHVGWWNCHYPWPGMHTDTTLSAARGVVAAGSTGYVGWYRNCHYLWQAHRHRTFSRTCAGFTEWFRNCHFFFLARTQIQHCQPHAGSWPCAQAPMMESCSFLLAKNCNDRREDTNFKTVVYCM